jgi:glycogen synthase
MIKVYYLVQEIAGPKNEAGILPPSEGGLGVAALNMLRASQQNLMSDVDFNLVLPGTQNVLSYFNVAQEITGSTKGSIIESRMPFSGEPVLIVCDDRLKGINSFSEQVRQPDGFLYSKVFSEILAERLRNDDIVHLNGWHFYTVASDIKNRVQNNNPIVLNIHIIRDVYRHIREGKEINPWGDVIDNSDVLVPVSRTYAQQIVTGANEPLSEALIKKIAQKNIFGIGNGFEKAEVYANVEHKSDEIAWIHRIDSRQKGLALLTEIVEALAASGSKWKTNVLGNAESSDSDAQSFVGKIKELQSAYPSIVNIDTSYSAEKKDEILRRSKIFLCTSLYEGSPYAVMEAMNYGLVSVVTPKAGLLDLITHGQNGFVSQDMGFESFRDALKNAFDLCASNRYPEMALAAQRSVPTPKEMFDNYRELYKACAEQTCAPTRFSDIVQNLNRSHRSISHLGL